MDPIILQRFGFFLPKINPKIWIHCASVGEIMGIKPFIDQLRNIPVVVSTMTKAGYNLAKEWNLSVLYLPIDFSFIVNRVLKKISPSLLIISETELWPNLIKEAKKQEIKLVLINGRLTEKSKKRYLMFGSLMKKVVSSFDLVLAQTEQDAERLSQLGAKEIIISGNTKFDWLNDDTPLPSIKFDDKKIIVFGSIREKEEDIVLRLSRRLHEEINDLTTVIAPRHLKRVSIILKKEPNMIRRSLTSSVPSRSILLLDTIGELKSFYKIASIAFVGGSLFPYGCHNLVEPAVFGVPVLFGKYTSNFSDFAEKLNDNGGFMVSDEKMLYEKILYLIKNEDIKRKIGEKAKNTAQSLMGASKINVHYIMKLL